MDSNLAFELVPTKNSLINHFSPRLTIVDNDASVALPDSLTNPRSEDSDLEGENEESDQPQLVLVDKVAADEMMMLGKFKQEHWTAVGGDGSSDFIVL